MQDYKVKSGDETNAKPDTITDSVFKTRRCWWVRD